MDSSGRVSIRQPMPGAKESIRWAAKKGFVSRAKIPEGCNAHLLLRILDRALAAGKLDTMGLVPSEAKVVEEIWEEYLTWKRTYNEEK